MRIRRLAEVPECLPQVRQLLTDVWPDWYGPNGRADPSADLAARMGIRDIPLGLVALEGAGTVLGTVALEPSGHGSAPGERAWLNGLAVARPSRRRGIGSALVIDAAAVAAHLGHRELFAAVREAAALFRRLGWTELRPLPDGWVVIRRALGPEVSPPERSAR